MTEAGVEPAEYQFAGGRQALLYTQRQTENSSNVKNHAHKSPKSAVSPLWLAAPDVLSGDTKAVIFDYVEIPENLLQKYLENHSQIKEVCTFEKGKLVKLEQKCIGAIVLESKKMPALPEDYAQAWINEIAKKGLACLPRDARIDNFLLRAEFVEQQKGSQKDATIEARLQENAREWLLPFLAGKTSLSSTTVYDALYWFLNGAEIDRLAPESIILENGRRVKVKYEKQAEIRPVVEIIIQRIFGCFTTPRICGKKVLFRLLSPASRPLQVTEDLENFWTGAWVEICKEMKGRYPKHNWDYRVVEKE
jgi:ATP-dependent helicase HrpB